MSEKAKSIEAAAQQALPTWVWGATAFIASYMVLQVQMFAA